MKRVTLPAFYLDGKRPQLTDAQQIYEAVQRISLGDWGPTEMVDAAKEAILRGDFPSAALFVGQIDQALHRASREHNDAMRVIHELLGEEDGNS